MSAAPLTVKSGMLEERSQSRWCHSCDHSSRCLLKGFKQLMHLSIVFFDEHPVCIRIDLVFSCAKTKNTLQTKRKTDGWREVESWLSHQSDQFCHRISFSSSLFVLLFPILRPCRVQTNGLRVHCTRHYPVTRQALQSLSISPSYLLSFSISLSNYFACFFY